jgi:hypothetical protein
MTWMSQAHGREPHLSPGLGAALSWLYPAAVAMALLQVFGWRPVVGAAGWLGVLSAGVLLIAIDARVAVGWRRTVTAGSLLLAATVGVILVATWAGAPMGMPGGALPPGMLLAMGLAWVVVLTATAGVALRAGLGPTRTALLATFGITLWAIPAGEAFTAITALLPAALSPEWAGWSRPSGLSVFLASPPLALLGWWRTRPHHPALAASWHPEILYLGQAVLVAGAAFRYGRPVVAGIGLVGMLAFIALPSVIRQQRREAQVRRIP